MKHLLRSVLSMFKKSKCTFDLNIIAVKPLPRRSFACWPYLTDFSSKLSSTGLVQHTGHWSKLRWVTMILGVAFFNGISKRILPPEAINYIIWLWTRCPYPIEIARLVCGFWLSHPCNHWRCYFLEKLYSIYYCFKSNNSIISFSVMIL